MPNSQELFAHTIENLTPAESDWADTMLAKLQEYFELAADVRKEEFTDLSEFAEYDHHQLPFTFTSGILNGKPSLNLYSDDEGDHAVLATFLWLFLRAWRPTQAIGLTYAQTCSRPLSGAFAGGAVFINYHGWDEFHLSEWLQQQTACRAA